MPEPRLLTPSPADVRSVLASRGTKELPGRLYKLAGAGEEGGQYGTDVVFSEKLDLDERRMSVWIPFVDGNRRDGVGDVTEIAGIVTERHRKNPISLFDHGKTVSLPIGLCEDPDSKEYTVVLDPASQTGKANVFIWQGAKDLTETDDPEVNEQLKKKCDHAVFCEQLFHMLATGLIRAGSFGYQVLRAEQIPADYQRGIPQGLHLIRVLLLEVSPVVLPANQDTVRKCLEGGPMCGRPLSPYLIKALSPYAPQKKAFMATGEKGEKYFTTSYAEAQRRAIDEANRYKVDVAILAGTEYGKRGFHVHLASRNDSDYARAEIIKPGTPQSAPQKKAVVTGGVKAAGKVKLADVKEAEKKYANALVDYGPNNQATIRAEIKYRELKEQYEAQKAGGKSFGDKAGDYSNTPAERAYMDGHRAGRHRAQKATNPHPAGSEEARQWEEGWKDGRKVSPPMEQDKSYASNPLESRDDWENPLSRGNVPPAKWKPGMGTVKQLRAKYQKSSTLSDLPASEQEELERLYGKGLSKEYGNRVAEYKGRKYRLLYLGQTKFGYRAKLGFFDGTKEFWVDGNSIREVSGPDRGRSDGMVRCRHCGKRTLEGDDWCMVCGRADYEKSLRGKVRKKLDPEEAKALAALAKDSSGRKPTLDPYRGEVGAEDVAATLVRKHGSPAAAAAFIDQQLAGGSLGPVERRVYKKVREALASRNFKRMPVKAVVHDGRGREISDRGAHVEVDTGAGKWSGRVWGVRGDLLVVVDDRGEEHRVPARMVTAKALPAAGSKSLKGLRQKWRTAKGNLRRLRKSVPGAAVLRVAGKDMEEARKLAAEKGLEFKDMGSEGGVHKVKLTGADGPMDEVAARYGQGVKSLPAAGTKDNVTVVHLRPARGPEPEIPPLTAAQRAELLERKRKLDAEHLDLKRKDRWTYEDNRRVDKITGQLSDIAAMLSGRMAYKGLPAAGTKMSPEARIADAAAHPDKYDDRTLAEVLRDARRLRLPEAADLEAAAAERGIKAMAKVGTRKGKTMTGSKAWHKDGGPLPGEPLGAQLLKRIHEDHSILMKDYDELLRVVEHGDVKSHVEELLRGHEAALSATEKLFAKAYKDLPPLGGGEEEAPPEETGEKAAEVEGEEAPEPEEPEGEAGAVDGKAMRTKAAGGKSAYDEGWNAALDNKRRSDCPYPSGSAEQREWDSGYVSAARRQDLGQKVERKALDDEDADDEAKALSKAADEQLAAAEELEKSLAALGN